MTQLSISQAREKLTRLANRPKEEQEPVEVTSRGKPVLAILPWDLYEALEETVDILGDENLQSQLKTSIQELKSGPLVSWEEIKKKLV